MVGVGVGAGSHNPSVPQTCPDGQSWSLLQGIGCVGVGARVPVGVGVAVGTMVTTARAKASMASFVSPGTILDAGESKATKAPSSLMLGGTCGRWHSRERRHSGLR